MCVKRAKSTKNSIKKNPAIEEITVGEIFNQIF